MHTLDEAGQEGQHELGLSVWRRRVLGVRTESNEVFVGTESGVCRARSTKMKPEGESRVRKHLGKTAGAPWEPSVGRRYNEPTRIDNAPVHTEELDPTPILRRRRRIGKQDIRSRSRTPKREGGRASDMKWDPRPHS